MKIIRKVTVFAIMLMAIASCNNKKEESKNYNVLWITCEDISPTLSFYGDTSAKTPNLDKLASESLVFDNAYTTVGVCAPSRSSIITGMYPASIGTQNMRTAHDVHGWGNRKYDGPSNAYDINGDYVPLYSAVVPSPVKCFTEYLRAKGYYCTNNAKCDYQFAAPVTAWDKNGRQANWKGREKNQPFFSVFNHEVTHESRMWINRKLPQTVDPKTVPLPPYFPEDGIVREDVARNYSNIELLDKQVGELLQKLKDDGEYENTIIFFFSDHGGPLPRGKREHYISGLKVPFMIRFPHAENKGRTNQLISFVDLAPTMLSLAGIKPPDYMQGKAFLGKYASKEKREYIFGSGDRFDEFSDMIRSVTDSKYLYVKNFHPELPAYKDVGYRKNMPMMNQLLKLRDEKKLNNDQMYWFRKTKTDEEFYDIASDPYQLNNLINDESYSNEIERFRGVLTKWQTKIDDKGFTPEIELVKKMWPNLKQPITANPILEENGDELIVSCPTENSSIAYILSDKDFNPDLDSGWKLYTEPIKKNKGKFLYIMANRIGFKDSEIIKIKI